MVVPILSELTKTKKDLACAICRQTIGLELACTGAAYPDGEQAFACRQHLRERAKRSLWIVCWADFVVRQKSRHTKMVEFRP